MKSLLARKMIMHHGTKEDGKDICNMCGGSRNNRKIIDGNPYMDLFAGDLCPSEFHGKLPGYNCF
jgi:hypothetical protein